MKLIVEATLVRDDGEHTGRFESEFPAPTDPHEVALVTMATLVELASGIVELITHSHEQPEPPKGLIGMEKWHLN